MGSGRLAAMSVLKSRLEDFYLILSMILIIGRWMPDMSEEDGKQMVRDAVGARIFNDMGSVKNVDLVVIKPMVEVSNVFYKIRLTDGIFRFSI